MYSVSFMLAFLLSTAAAASVLLGRQRQVEQDDVNDE